MDVEGVKETVKQIAWELEDAADVLGADELEDAADVLGADELEDAIKDASRDLDRALSELRRAAEERLRRWHRALVSHGWKCETFSVTGTNTKRARHGPCSPCGRWAAEYGAGHVTHRPSGLRAWYTPCPASLAECSRLLGPPRDNEHEDHGVKTTMGYTLKDWSEG